MKCHRFLSIPVSAVLLLMGFVYYITVFVFIEDWVGLQSSAGSLNALIFTFLGFLCLVSFSACVLIDPGHVPPSYVPDVEQSRALDQEPNNNGAQPRPCDKCFTYKPPRAHHCRICRRCVLRMDHHCMWINNCVGYWNYKAFFVLVLYAAISSIYSTVVLISCSFQKDFSGRVPLKVFYVICGAGMIGLSVTFGTLLGWHVYLIIHNMTTIEYHDKGVSWPVFRWAGDKEDKYFARIGKNIISVYETETFSLIDKKSLKVENVVDFSWSPTDPIFALFVPELGDHPARVSLMQIPSKDELRQKNLFSVSECKMYWQSNGDYLAVKVDRYTKTKKNTCTGFELFRIRERDIPIEVFELENKNDKIIAFAWEPKGHRFAIIHGDNPRPDISFYSMRSVNNTDKVKKLTTLKGKQANTLFWSPAGRFIILAGLKGFNGQLEFYDVDELETIATAEHFMATDIEWDPTGRYVGTAVNSVHEMENGFNIWSFNGRLLYRILKDHFFQLLWRPRPPSVLSPEKEEEIAKNLKKYSMKYKVEDQDVSMLLSEQDRDKRRMLKDEWDKWVTEWKHLHEVEKLERLELRDGEASDEEESEAKEVEVEEILDVTEEVLSFED